MATQTKTRSRRSSNSGSGTRDTTAESRTRQAAADNVEATAERIRDVNERIIESAKKAGNVYLDIYEKTLRSIADYEDRVADTSQVEWISAVAAAQASFTRDVARAYSSAARNLLK